MSINYKKILQTLEHIVLIVIVSGSIAFWLGMQYGKTQVDVKALKTAPVASQEASK